MGLLSVMRRAKVPTPTLVLVSMLAQRLDMLPGEPRQSPQPNFWVRIPDTQITVVSGAYYPRNSSARGTPNNPQSLGIKMNGRDIEIVAADREILAAAYARWAWRGCQLWWAAEDARNQQLALDAVCDLLDVET